MFKKIKDTLKKKLPNFDEFENDEYDEHEWLADQYTRLGFKSYIRSRDIMLMKSMTKAVEANDFYKAKELNGKRLQLLSMYMDSEKYYKKFELEEFKRGVH